jgi:hypothetical protein
MYVEEVGEKNIGSLERQHLENFFQKLGDTYIAIHTYCMG